ncbi:flagellar biosynthesis protein FlhB [Helicobacter sp. MIT 14-3879]|uniref:flagellar biosynthesis protein FlhB n=1 Tax=Helicobacter sp. MIT 14-3879 TaxID=2040649 RepID=UPI000E1FA54D|nr:flagellar biosynthesis protein FlhB [Helicobacter sp. MIT 14-3879]RDU65583.1 flagellar biosynthesis protein FlhB [Helicobacter sp. MIT 14-3879]
MAQEEEKTELPSEHKLQKAREEGNVRKSQEVIGFLALFTGFIAIFFLLPYLAQRINKLFVFVMNFNLDSFTDSGMMNLAIFIMTESIIIVAPIFLALLVVGVGANILQFGFLITIKTIIPKFSKLNMITGFKNVISLRKLLDGILITLKVSFALSLGFFVFISFLKELSNIAFLNIFYQLIWLKDKTLILASMLLILFFFMAILDFFIKRKQYINSLKMTKQEVKDEYKQLQGNPQIRARIRQTMRKMSSQKMLSNVKKANVVITNPTHYAVAIKFTMNVDIAPIVVAKGTDLLAIRIKEIARQNNIPIRESKELARELYRLVDIDNYIPVELFAAVAKVFTTIEEFNKGNSF